MYVFLSSGVILGRVSVFARLVGMDRHVPVLVPSTSGAKAAQNNALARIVLSVCPTMELVSALQV